MSAGRVSLRALQYLTPVVITGNDARKFLQGQLSNDVRKLSPQTALLASQSSGRGRVQSILTLLERPAGLFAILPTHAERATIERMRHFVLREQVTFHEPTHDWFLAPVTEAELTTLGIQTPPQEPGACVTTDSASVLRWWSREPRYLLLGRRAAFDVSADATGALDHAWHLADVHAGLPAIHAASYDKFVAQQLDLDTLGAISYDKGCYVGQEIIARARRAEKRRVLALYTATSAPPLPGTALWLAGEPVGEVVDAAADGAACALLAVVDAAHTASPLHLSDTSHSTLELVKRVP